MSSRGKKILAMIPVKEQNQSDENSLPLPYRTSPSETCCKILLGPNENYSTVLYPDDELMKIIENATSEQENINQLIENEQEDHFIELYSLRNIDITNNTNFEGVARSVSITDAQDTKISNSDGLDSIIIQERQQHFALSPNVIIETNCLITVSQENGKSSNVEQDRTMEQGMPLRCEEECLKGSCKDVAITDIQENGNSFNVDHNKEDCSDKPLNGTKKYFVQENGKLSSAESECIYGNPGPAFDNQDPLIHSYLGESVLSLGQQAENHRQEGNDNIVGEEEIRKEKKGSFKEKQKQLRIQGKQHVQRNKKIKPQKNIQPDPCRGKKCQLNCSDKFNDDQRLKLFRTFYSMHRDNEQNHLLASCVQRVPIKRRYGDKNLESRRTTSKAYFLPLEGEKVAVCQQLFLATLSISQKKIRCVDENKTEMNTAKPEQRGHKLPPNKTSPAIILNLEHYIKMLPAVPSHYCRGVTTRRYLPQEFRNIANLYKIYKKHCTENEQTFVSEKLFRQIFKSRFNIGFHLPKKDKCVICSGPKNSTNENDSFMLTHLMEKQDSQTNHLQDQQQAKDDPTFVCRSFDLQKVLNTPHGNSILMYYSRKYAFYNETIYESGTRNVYCYLWGERDGKREANEIGTILYDYLKIGDDRHSVKSFSLFCDSCSGQNKNRQIISATVWFLRNISKNIENISITYLLPGHTYMPVDSVHTTIENKIRRQIIWAPSEWPTVIRNARNNLPYNVLKMEFNYFKDFKYLQSFVFPDTIKKTDSGEALKISKLRRVVFLKGSDTIKLYYSYNKQEVSKTLTLLHRPASRNQTNQILPQLYNKPQPISQQKFKDLSALVQKGMIPEMYKSEYLALQGSEQIGDVLAETDEEDDNVENEDELEPPKRQKREMKKSYPNDKKKLFW